MNEFLPGGRKKVQACGPQGSLVQTPTADLIAIALIEPLNDVQLPAQLAQMPRVSPGFSIGRSRLARHLLIARASRKGRSGFCVC